MNQRKEIDVLDLFAALGAGKRLIILSTLLVCVAAAALSFVIPEEYEAVVQLLPPKEAKKGFGFAELLSDLPIPSLRLGEKGSPADIFIAVLESPTMRRRMIKEFGLMEHYGVDKMGDAIETLGAKANIGKSEHGTIMISVLDRDPKLATEMANRYVSLLDTTNQGLSRENAFSRLAFIDRLKASEIGKLEVAMEKLQVFQAEHNAISIEDQAKAVIRAAAQIQMTVMDLEVQRNVLMAAGLSPNHVEIVKMEEEIRQHGLALEMLRNGPSEDGEESEMKIEQNLFLPLSEIPQVAQDFARIETEVTVQGALMKLLLQQHAEALIEASNTTSTVQVLDWATVPEEKAKPQRFLIVFLAFVLSLFASCSYVLGAAYIQFLRLRWKDEYAQKG
jgi:tyrosine-protein kinase Etk/Wzc